MSHLRWVTPSLLSLCRDVCGAFYIEAYMLSACGMRWGTCPIRRLGWYPIFNTTTPSKWYPQGFTIIFITLVYCLCNIIPSFGDTWANPDFIWCLLLKKGHRCNPLHVSKSPYRNPHPLGVDYALNIQNRARDLRPRQIRWFTNLPSKYNLYSETFGRGHTRSTPVHRKAPI